MHTAISSLIREIVTDAICYWEHYRIVYNVVLAAIVLFHLVAHVFSTLGHTHVMSKLPVLFVLGVAANIAYTTVYIIDIPVQLSAFQQTWKARRILLFYIGLLTAMLFAWSISSTLFLDA